MHDPATLAITPGRSGGLGVTCGFACQITATRHRPAGRLMHPQDATARGLADGQRVTAYNGNGEVEFVLKATERVPAGTVVMEGV